MKLFNVFLIMSLFLMPLGVSASIFISSSSNPKELYAAQEMQRYYYQSTGEYLKITSVLSDKADAKFILSHSNSPLSQEIKAELNFSNELGEEGYILQSLLNGEKQQLVIYGGSEVGLLYGVYGLLEDYFRIAFYYSGDVIPENKKNVNLSNISEVKIPEMKVRGMLPWTNFPQSATTYSWSDWKFVIDQTAKMRMNFIMIHNYNGGAGHNEMFHNFEHNNYLSRSWMATIRSGHGWSAPAWDLSEYLFRSSDLYNDYDFGADCALHNEHLSNKQVFRKGVSLFQKVIEYAHTRGVKIGLGLDIDLVPSEYNTDPYDATLVKSRVKQIAVDYPNLDYLVCFQSENPNKDDAFYVRWNKTFNEFYAQMRQQSPGTRIVVSGWGLTASSVELLPKDVICAPISFYSSSFASGDIYGEREYWGCPWLERDFNSSQYYYPYNVHLTQSISSYQAKAKNMTGLFALTWRLTDAIEPKIWYTSKAPWRNDLISSEKVYSEYAAANYGKHNTREITEIINENESFATDFAECQETPKFNLVVNNYPLLNILDFEFIGRNKSRKHKAIDYFKHQGVQNVATLDTLSCVAHIDNGDWVLYKNVDLEGYSEKLKIQVASASNGGKIVVVLDSLSGEVIGDIDVDNTEGWHAWKTLEMGLKETKGIRDVYFKFELLQTVDYTLAKANRQIDVIKQCINDPKTSNIERRRLALLQSRIEGVKYHIKLNQEFDGYKWEDFPGYFPQWTESFANRITDISSFGNIQSIQNRFIKQNYLDKIKQLQKLQQIKAPSNLVAKGTQNGANLEWKDEDYNTRFFEIYRNEVLIATVPHFQVKYNDVYSEFAKYSVVAVDSDGNKSKNSIPMECFAGKSDIGAPQIIAISSPVSHNVNEQLSFKIILRDNRDEASMSVKLHYRVVGEAESWKVIDLKHRTKYTFVASIGNIIKGKLLEYYLVASDGKQESIYPETAPKISKTIVLFELKAKEKLSVPKINNDTNILTWQNTPERNIHQYYIYRGLRPDFTVDETSFVTYVSKETNSYKDHEQNFDSSPLKGVYYYKMCSTDLYGNVSESSKAVKITY